MLDESINTETRDRDHLQATEGLPPPPTDHLTSTRVVPFAIGLRHFADISSA